MVVAYHSFFMSENWYIAVYRSLLESEIMEKPPEWFKLWTVILLKCNFEDRGIYKRGEFTTKYEYLASEACVSFNVVDKFLRWAVSRNMVETRKLTRGVIIRVIKYDDFQVKSETEAKQKRNTVDTINKRIKKEGNNIIPPIPLEGGGVDKEEKDFYTEGLNRIDNPKLREAAEKWYRYKKERKDTYKPIGWETLITLILKNDAALVIERIDEAISSGWKGINLATAQKNKNTTRRVEYYGILDEWIEPIRVLARNSLRDHETASRREADENTTRRLLYESVIKYYKQPGKLSEDESTAINEKVWEWRTQNKKESYESTPSDVIVRIIKDVLFKK